MSKVQTVIQKDAFDQMVFEGVKEAPRIGELCDTNEGATQDVFNGLYKMEPTVSAEAPTAPRNLVKQMLDLPEFQHLRAMTQMDEISSALGTLNFAPELIENVKKVEKKLEEKRKQAKKNGGAPFQEPERLEDILSENEMSEVRQGFRRAAEQSQEQVEDWQEACSAWGIQPGELAQVPFEKRFEFAEQIQNSEKLKKIADLVGRFKNVVNSASAQIPVHGNDEIVDVGLGSNISRMLPSELLKLRRTPKLFYKDMVEGKLQVYNLKGTDNLGKGPIISIMDISGSMAYSCNGVTRDEWAKAVVLALMHLAEKQRRAFGYISFEAIVRKSAFWPRGSAPSLNEKIEIAQTLTDGGGTEFYPPLQKAFAMRANEIELKPADIVFITDGECKLQQPQIKEIAALKAETNVRIYGIAINVGSGGSSGETLHSFCDQVAVINSLGEIEMVKDMVVATASDIVRK